MRGYYISHYLFHFSVAVLSSRMSALRRRLVIIRLIRQEHKPPVTGSYHWFQIRCVNRARARLDLRFRRSAPCTTRPHPSPHRNIPYHGAAPLEAPVSYHGGGRGLGPRLLLHWIMVRSESFSHPAPGFTCTSTRVQWGRIGTKYRTSIVSCRAFPPSILALARRWIGLVLCA